MNRGRGRVLLLISTSLFVASAACSALIGLDAPPSDESSDASPEATNDTPAPPDGNAVSCVPLDMGGGAYSPFAQVARDDAGALTWELFESTSVPSFRSSADFAGGTFDGRYVYYAARNRSVVRFDTKGAFGDASAWSLASQPSGTGPFEGAVFDGRYVIFVPSIGTGVAPLAARFDTTLDSDFTSTASVAWQYFDVSTLGADGGAPTAGYAGGIFDGHYVYFVPRNDGVGPFGRVARFDTGGSLDAGTPDADAGDGGDTAGFANPAAWSTFDLSTVSPAAMGYVGGVFAAGAIFLAPETNNYLDAEVNGGSNAIAVRYALDGSFTASSAWSTFDTTRVRGSATGYLGGTFDGRFVYLVPRANGIVMRYDTSASFGSQSAWSAYDTTMTLQLDGAALRFFGGAFDGRFIYFVPNDNGSSVAVRYDTLSPFEAPCAWSTFDVGQLSVLDAGIVSRFVGAVFDGQFVYLVPSGPLGSAFVRFAARAPGPLPNIPQFHGSFL